MSHPPRPVKSAATGLEHAAHATPERLGKAGRQQRILAELRVDPALRVSELAARFAVTTETIRRDLDHLAGEGLIARTYGGAAAAAAGGGEPNYNERYRQRLPERRRIAATAALLVRPGEVLMIDAGSTTTHFARRLAAECRALTVFTNSVGVATALAAGEDMRVVLCPGDYDPREGGVCGPETQAFITRFHALRCFIGASGLSTEGPADANPQAAWVKRAMIERSDHAVLLIDASKFDVSATDRICPLADLEGLVCDRAPAPSLAHALARADVEVHVAPR